ncbi:MAG: VOC family protein [Thermoleophilaceae bacterium]
MVAGDSKLGAGLGTGFSGHRRVFHAGRATRARLGRLELIKFHAPSGPGGDPHAPANTPGLRHLAFAVDDIDAVVASVRARGGELVGEVESYEDIYRLRYVRGPEGIIVERAEQIG